MYTQQTNEISKFTEDKPSVDRNCVIKIILLAGISEPDKFFIELNNIKKKYMPFATWGNN